MKPLSLEIDAFGSFADREVIDFAALAERRLFLIHGPTGAGKSTILEAICFALYGAPSGGSELAVGTHLRSQHAAPGCATRVALEFALGDTRYRVERAPRQRRASARAKSGFVEDKPSATLWRMKADATPDDPGTPLATKPSDVDARVRELLGLDRAQFRQVILLPQGEFRKLLEASTKDREDILARLFDIDRFADIERRLKQAADALERELGGLERDRRTLLSQAGVDSDEAFALAQKALGESLAEAQQVLEARSATADAARKALEAGRDVARRFAEREAAERALVELDARAPEFENLREREARAARAEGPGERLDARDRSARELTVAAARLEEAVDASAEAREVAIAAQNEELAYRERAPELRGFDERRAMLVAARTAAQEIETRRRDHAERVAALEALRRTIAKSRAALETAREAAQGAEEAAAGRGRAEDALRSATARRDAIDARLDWAARVAAAERRLAELDAAIAPLRETTSSERRRIADLEAALAEARRVDRERVAARLAETLREGEPCPVCGSASHPAPASQPVPTSHPAPASPPVSATDGRAAHDGAARPEEAQAEDALERSEAALSDARRALEVTSAKLSALEGERSSEARARDALEEEGVRIAAASPAATEVARLEASTLEAERAAAEATRADAQGAVDRAVAAEAERDARRAAVESAREALEAPTRQEVALATGLEAAQQAIEEAEARLPEGVQSLDAVEAELESLAARRERLEAEIEGSRERAGKAQAEQVARERVEGERREAVAAARAAVEAASDALATALAQGGFDDERALVAARMDARDRVALRERIGEFDRGRAAAREQLEAKRAATQDIEAVDLDALQGGFDTADAARAEAQDRVGALRERKAEQDKLDETLARQRAASGRLLARFERVGSLANVAGGDNAHRTSFQRFVLAAFLDEVLEVASHSLHRMSKGRYALVRATGVEDRRRRGGLDLAVQDAHTGDERPAATLSGGESFCAALALALGLAEVVQRHSGGTRLDAIFVDEGFGSLDPESLELALGTLVELQSGGRLVGLISHVPELKERIETRLEVTTGRGGSQLALVAP